MSVMIIYTKQKIGTGLVSLPPFKSWLQCWPLPIGKWAFVSFLFLSVSSVIAAFKCGVKPWHLRLFAKLLNNMSSNKTKSSEKRKHS